MSGRGQLGHHKGNVGLTTRSLVTAKQLFLPDVLCPSKYLDQSWFQKDSPWLLSIAAYFASSMHDPSENQHRDLIGRGRMTPGLAVGTIYAVLTLADPLTCYPRHTAHAAEEISVPREFKGLQSSIGM